jgi:hypothetical protein
MMSSAMLERRHQRLGQVHVGILSPIAGDRRPVARKLLGDRAMLGFPEASVEDFGYVGEHPVGQRMPDDFGARCREQHEGVPVSLLGRIFRPVVVDRPEITPLFGVAVLFPEKAHAVVDDVIGARPAKKARDGEAVNHPGGGVDWANRIFRRERLAPGVEIDEAAASEDCPRLEIIEQRFGLIPEPGAMIGPRLPIAETRRVEPQTVHRILPRRPVFAVGRTCPKRGAFGKRNRQR